MPNDIDTTLHGEGLLGDALAPKRQGRIIVYGVIDPRTNEIGYVGVTKQNLHDRAIGHACCKGNSPRSRWFQELRSAEIEPDFFALQELEVDEDWMEAERFWIAYWKFLGAHLTNRTKGGDGPKDLERSTKTRQKMRYNALRQFSDPISKEEWLIALRLSRGAPQSRKKMSRIAKEVQNRPEVKEKISMAAIRQHSNPEAKQRHRDGVKAAMNRPETKAKRAAIFATQEFRDKVSKGTSIGRQRQLALRRDSK